MAARSRVEDACCCPLALAVGRVKEAAEIRTALVKQMSPEQLAEGYKRTKELRAQIEARLKRDGK